MSRHRFTTPERVAIGAEAQKGTPERIQHKFGCSRAEFYDLKKRYRQNSPLRTKHASGRPCKLTITDVPKIERVLRRVHRANEHLSLEKLAEECAAVAPRVHPNTLRAFLRRSITPHTQPTGYPVHRSRRSQASPSHTTLARSPRAALTPTKENGSRKRNRPSAGSGT
ncbi:hypothetical protein Q8F55_004448 [Vanrija albida]|uniref:Transposase Tc1-like domain-containing protein n=1 Tax=Vanrija albida TaxID=181172 RepID=A0ABR3Q7J5_9TREE